MLSATLPDLSRLDREALQALLVAEHEERMATEQRLLTRESEIEHLKLLIAKLQRMQFGRKSEKRARQIEQLELRLEELQLSSAEQATPQPTTPLLISSFPAKPRRQPLPDHLPRQILSQRIGMPGLRWKVAEAGGRCFRDVGVLAGGLLCDSPCASQTELQRL